MGESERVREGGREGGRERERERERRGGGFPGLGASAQEPLWSLATGLH